MYVYRNKYIFRFICGREVVNLICDIDIDIIFYCDIGEVV